MTLEETDWKDDKIAEFREIIRQQAIRIEELEELQPVLKTADTVSKRLELPMELWPKVLRLKMQDKPIVFLVQENKIYDLLFS